MKPRDKTAKVLAEMLKENTGMAMGDSGGMPEYGSDGCYTGSSQGYGRNFERNQCRRFDQELATRLSCDGDGISVTHNVYHWLLEKVEYDPDMQRRFTRFVNKWMPDDHWLACMEAFPEHLRELGYEVGEPFTINTYNGKDLLDQTFQKDLLDQTLQYVGFKVDGEPYALIQIHGGADIRGGYTAPHVFYPKEDLSYLMDNARATIVCRRDDYNPAQGLLPGTEELRDNGPHYWDTDDGYHWYRDGTAGLGARRQLEDYELIDQESERGKGKVYYDSGGQCYCPICGSLLEAFA